MSVEIECVDCEHSDEYEPDKIPLNCPDCKGNVRRAGAES